MQLCFFVAGVPVPQGSHRAFKLRNSDRVIITDATPKTKPWKMDIRSIAQDKMSEAGKPSPLVGAASVHLDFIFNRPKGHYNAKGALKTSAPITKETKPDIDKLVRAVFDALTGVVYHDDSQVVSLSATKRFVKDGEVPGVFVNVNF